MDYFQNLERIILEEVGANKEIAVYPFGKMGRYAKKIVEGYGKKAILIDNKLAIAEEEIITIDDFLEAKMENVCVIVCAINIEINRGLYEDLLRKSSEVRVRNVFEVPVFLSEEKKSYFEQIRELCAVKASEEYNLVRIGKDGDGGYVMLDDLANNRLAYSFGICDDISWDKAIARYGLEVYCYDPTINGLPEECEGLHFEPIGITGDDEEDKSLYSMSSIIKKNQHEQFNNILLKMDVEGAEWDFLEEVSSEVLSCFSQMSFELHNMTDINKQQKIISCLKKIRKTHAPIWIHANNHGVSEKAGEYQVPEYLEITFVNRERYKLIDTSYSCPIEIDMPNYLGYLDIELKNWGSLQ